MPGSPPITVQRTDDCQAKTSPTLPGNSSGFMLLCRKTVSYMGGLLQRLAHNRINGQRYNCKTPFMKIFAQTAIPDVLWTDRGPQFMAH